MIKKMNLILIIIWMIAVFSFSNQTSVKSSGVSGKVTSKIVTFLHITEGCTEEASKIVMSNIENIIRKIAHYLLYALGGFLIYLELSQWRISSALKIILAQILGTTYACTDEIHQLFISGRSGEIRDVIIDSCGFFGGIIVAIILLLIIEKRELKKNERKSIHNI